MSVVPETLGWVGAGSLLSAYALVSHGRVTGHGWAFQALNLLGAAGLLVNGVHHRAWPSAALNAIWLLVGVAALVPARRSERVGTRGGARRTRSGQSPDSSRPDAPDIHHPHRQEQP